MFVIVSKNVNLISFCIGQSLLFFLSSFALSCTALLKSEPCTPMSDVWTLAGSVQAQHHRAKIPLREPTSGAN